MTRMLQLLSIILGLTLSAPNTASSQTSKGGSVPPSPIIFLLIFFGNLTRTNMMIAIAIMDGSPAVLFTAYLLGP
jgi:uncharacterized membrane protein SpoIIM required for sporulation